eukprot:2853845-Rhodomonas_salina.1
MQGHNPIISCARTTPCSAQRKRSRICKQHIPILTQRLNAPRSTKRSMNPRQTPLALRNPRLPIPRQPNARAKALARNRAATNQWQQNSAAKSKEPKTRAGHNRAFGARVFSAGGVQTDTPKPKQRPCTCSL